MKAPVIVLVYNRLTHLQECINRLLACGEATETELFISSDAPYREQDVEVIKQIRDYIKSISGFSKITCFAANSNKGLLKSYQDVLAEVFKKYDRFIFLEDDVVVSPDFLNYMNKGLDYYSHNLRVYSISAFSFSLFYSVQQENRKSVYTTNRFYPWGFASWRDRFLSLPSYSLEDLRASLSDKSFTSQLQKNGKDLYPAFLSLLAQKEMLVLDYFNTYHMVKNNLVTVVPYISKSFNIGHDGSGTRTIKNERFNSIDISFLDKMNEVAFASDVDAVMNNDFNNRHFNRVTDRIKLMLNNIGLLGIAMKSIQWIRFKKNS